MNLFTFLLVHPITRAVGLTLIHSLWQGAVVAIPLIMGLAMLKRRSSNARYLVACFALLLIAACPVVTLWKGLPSGASPPPPVGLGLSIRGTEGERGLVLPLSKGELEGVKKAMNIAHS